MAGSRYRLLSGIGGAVMLLHSHRPKEMGLNLPHKLTNKVAPLLYKRYRRYYKERMSYWLKRTHLADALMITEYELYKMAMWQYNCLGGCIAQDILREV